jgi:magnesium chelatase family protein
MLVKIFGSAVYGVEAITITVEVNWMATGKDCLIVGLPDNAVKESMQRVESTIKTNSYTMPRTRIVVNLAPADIKKSGTAFDLPIAVGVLAASEQFKNHTVLDKYLMMGELSLDGTLRPIKGACPLPYRHGRKVLKDSFCRQQTPAKRAW